MNSIKNLPGCSGNRHQSGLSAARRYRRNGLLLTALALIIILLTACAASTNDSNTQPAAPGATASTPDTENSAATVEDQGGSKTDYPEDTAGVVGDTTISEDDVQLEIRERELTLVMRNKLAELFSSGQGQAPKEVVLTALGIQEKDLNAEQKRYLNGMEDLNRPLTANEAFNKIMREETLYQEAQAQGYQVSAEEALAALQQGDAVTAQQMGQSEENKAKYAELLRYETELYAQIGFQSREDYWHWHAPQTAKAATINRLKNKFTEKIGELYPDVTGYALQIKQENAWQDYAEYLLKEKKAQAVMDQYALEFNGEEWQHGQLALGE